MKKTLKSCITIVDVKPNEKLTVILKYHIFIEENNFYYVCKKCAVSVHRKIAEKIASDYLWRFNKKENLL